MAGSTIEQNLPALERQAEIDIGYDERFESRWCTFERSIWAAFAVLITAGILGFFGRGPLNQVKRTLPDGTTVQYERVVRFKSPSMMTLTVPVNNGVATLETDRAAAKKLGFQQVVPQQTQDLGSEQVGPIQFRVAAPDTKSIFMELSMQPSGIGKVKTTYRVNRQSTFEITQFVLP